MRLKEPRWARFVDAAVGESTPTPRKTLAERFRRQAGDLQRRLAAAHEEQADSQEHQRPDIRLLPSVVAAWAAAALATALPGDVLPALAAGPVVLGLGALALMMRGRAGRARRARRQPRTRPEMRPRRMRRIREQARHRRRAADGESRGPVAMHGAPAARGSPGATLLLAGVCAAGVLAVVGLGVQSSAMAPLGKAVLQGRDVVVTLEVAGTPRRLEGGNGPPRVVLDALVIRAEAAGRVTTGRLAVRVVAGTAWAGVREGQEVATAGRVQKGQGSDRRSAYLRPTTAPLPVAAGPGAAGTGAGQPLPAAIRAAWIAAVRQAWGPHSQDAAALLPGMVMGDRSALDGSLNESMKVVGLTHLTAVSGANCTLVLASLMLALRSLRAPRLPAAGASLAGLAGFVVLVGPDPSVLRAAVMGAIGAMAVLGGRPRRVGALLSVSIVVLLLADPWLALDFAFILSVLATLGLHLVGQRCVRWLSVMLPLWLAQAIAIPLAAQLFCAPVIVLLQARLTPYTVVANMAAAPVIALVTTVGTFGMVCALLVPQLAVLCAAASGAGAWWVAVVARWMSALPAASLPWPGGAAGAALMALLNGAVLLGLVAIVERRRAACLAGMVVGRLPAWWRHRFGFASLVVLAAGAAFWWSWAVVNS